MRDTTRKRAQELRRGSSAPMRDTARKRAQDLDLGPQTSELRGRMRDSAKLGRTESGGWVARAVDFWLILVVLVGFAWVFLCTGALPT